MFRVKSVLKKDIAFDGFKAVARGYDRSGRQRFKSPECP